MPQYTSPSGIAQLNTMFPALVSTAPAIAWNGTIAAKMHAHIVVSLRLIALNLADAQYCSGTRSRAYSWVNGVNNNEATEISDRINAAIPRAYRATQWAVEASARNATITNPINVTTAPSSSNRGRPARTPRPAITIAVASAASDPIFSVACEASTVNTIHGMSAMKMPLPPPLGSAVRLSFEDIEVSFRFLQ